MNVASPLGERMRSKRASLPSSAVGGGENLPADQLAKLTLTFKGEEIIPGDRHDDVAKYKLDPTQRPPAIDLTERNGKTSLGIYEMEGDTLRLCFSASGMARPDVPSWITSLCPAGGCPRSGPSGMSRPLSCATSAPACCSFSICCANWQPCPWRRPTLRKPLTGGENRIAGPP